MSKIVGSVGGYESDEAVAALDWRTWTKSLKNMSEMLNAKSNATWEKPESDKKPEPDKKPESDTKNVKGNRKIVFARYSEPEIYFKLPDGLDLKDKSNVTEWSVRGTNLYIKYVDGTEQYLDPWWPAECDLNQPYEAELLDMEENPGGHESFYADEDDEDGDDETDKTDKPDKNDEG